MFYIKFFDSEKQDYQVTYTVSFRKRDSRYKTNNESDSINSEESFFKWDDKIQIKRAFIEEEKIDYRIVDKKTRSLSAKKTLLHVTEENILPKYRRESFLFHTEKKYFIHLVKDKSKEANRSFIFSEDIAKVLSEKKDQDEWEILLLLKQYASNNLFVMDNHTLSLSSANIVLPMSIRNYKVSGVREYTDGSSGVVPIPLEESSFLPSKVLEEVKKSLKSSNIVLSELIPNFKIELEEIEKFIDTKNKNELSRFRLLSVREDRKIPIKYESDGIKKIVAIIHVLIAMYHHEHVTVLIDELDSGIFEYLLGELLEILEERGAGQLIFTSHNLRPLEVLKKNDLVFTTINPNNRFIKFKNLESDLNLRDSYYRDLVLHTQKEITYDRTSSIMINRAFRKVGHSQ